MFFSMPLSCYTMLLMSEECAICMFFSGFFMLTPPFYTAIAVSPLCWLECSNLCSAPLWWQAPCRSSIRSLWKHSSLFVHSPLISWCPNCLDSTRLAEVAYRIHVSPELKMDTNSNHYLVPSSFKIDAGKNVNWSKEIYKIMMQNILIKVPVKYFGNL